MAVTQFFPSHALFSPLSPCSLGYCSATFVNLSVCWDQCYLEILAGPISSDCSFYSERVKMPPFPFFGSFSDLHNIFRRFDVKLYCKFILLRLKKSWRMRESNVNPLKTKISEVHALPSELAGPGVVTQCFFTNLRLGRIPPTYYFL